MNKISRFLLVSQGRRAILAEALLFKYKARVLLFLLPVRMVLRISYNLEPDVSSPDAELLEKIRWTLIKGGRLSHGRNSCLVKSLAGRWMLHRRGLKARLFFGVRINENGVPVAHSWLTSESIEVVPAGEGYTILAEF